MIGSIRCHAVLASLHAEIGDGLAQLVALLRVPVLLMALGVLLLCAVEVGRYAAEVVRRRRRIRFGTLEALATGALSDPHRAGMYAAAAPSEATADAVARIAAAGAAGNRQQAEAALADFELFVQRRLDRTRLLVRAGPAVGLMGTLVPLAPGLQALGEGNMQLLASELRVAFAATVVGLLVGTTAFAITLWRTRAYTEDLAALERGAGPVTSVGVT